MNEHELQTSILEKFGAHPDIRIWRTNTGLSYGYGPIQDIFAKVNVLGTMASHGAEVRAHEIYNELIRLMKKIQPTRYLLKGHADIAGICSYEGKTGKTFGRFLAIEVKIKPNRPTQDQEAWGKMVESRGGIWILAYSVECVQERLKSEGFDV